MADQKKDIRLQVFVSDTMDDKLTDIADLMGIRKNDVVRYAIAMFCASWSNGIDVVKDYANKQLKGQVSIDDLKLGKVRI